MRSKPIYWLILKANIDKNHRKLQISLESDGVETTFVAEFSTLFDTYNHKRTSTVIIGDEFTKRDLMEGLSNTHKNPEPAATRLILSISCLDTSTIRKVIFMGFRDVIPLDLKAQE